LAYVPAISGRVAWQPGWWQSFALRSVQCSQYTISAERRLSRSIFYECGASTMEPRAV
jgi:hypothetical protein